MSMKSHSILFKIVANEKDHNTYTTEKININYLQYKPSFTLNA